MLVGAALALGARSVEGWSESEESLAARAESASPELARRLRGWIEEGLDPLGECLSRLRSPGERRSLGATYTPGEIVASMVAWAARNGEPTRVVDPGTGTARFLVAAGRRLPSPQLVGVEVDPTAALLARAHLAAAGLAHRSSVIVGDYHAVRPGATGGPTLYLGNPPYVRHHLIDPEWKRWLSRQARSRGLGASQLAGLHVHFFLATAAHAAPGDYGAFITAAEWLDVNYGRLVRQLLLGDLGGLGVDLVEPTAMPFPDANTTAAITTFRIGERVAQLRLRRIEKLAELGDLSDGRLIPRDRMEAESRWSRLTRGGRQRPAGFVELGELCRVHRGQATGANKTWIAGEHGDGLPPSVLFPSVTRAREIIAAGAALRDASRLRSVIDLPESLDGFSESERAAIDRLLRRARAEGAHQTYIARHRTPWWSVGLREPAPILATYMARRPPAFARNLASARHLNIAHGLYPREPMSELTLSRLVRCLSEHTDVSDGRTYAGGLTKFEPREMEKILVPGPALLAG